MDDSSKTVLIIEDEQALLDSYTEILQGAGFQVLKALDGYKGLEALKNGHASIDLVLLDLMLPGIDGLEVLRTVKGNLDEYGQAPIVVLTSMTSEKVIKQAFDLGATSYLLKGELDYDVLVPEINKVLGAETL
jgi:DNA-binding response OmpR family regulator